jgi:hypothetical protein
VTAIQIGHDESLFVRYSETDNTTGTVRILEPEQDSLVTGPSCLVITAYEAERITGVVTAVCDAIADAHGSVMWAAEDQPAVRPKVRRIPGIRQPGDT